MTSNHIANLTLQLYSGDPADTELLNRQIRQELQQASGVEVTSPEIDALPNDAKSGSTAVDWTTIYVTIAASGGIITTVIGAILSRLTRERKVTIEIDGDKLELTGISSKEQQRLMELWILRHHKDKKSHAK
jgi:hypothetical protein